jgi:hypothetical protein
VEVLLTASPQAFKRQANGSPHNWHGSPWAEANIAFLKDKFGEKNVFKHESGPRYCRPLVH